jgi:hypothetical protein
MLAMGDIRAVYAARNMQEAYLLRDFLEDRGIRAIVMNAGLEGGAGVDVLGWPTLARVAVDEEHAVAARQIALEFDRLMRDGADVAAGEAADRQSLPEWDKQEEAPDASLRVESPPTSWPRCPQCGAPRITRCPVCGTSGSEFPQADGPGEEDSDEPAHSPLLICNACDEPFTPEYAHDCEWCGHEFPEGFRPVPKEPVEDLSPRLLVVAGAALAVVVLVFAYLASLVGHGAGP